MLNNRYPEDWKKIATRIKIKANWTCQLCGLQCIPSQQKNNKLSRSERAKLRLEVHHNLYKPELNEDNQLIALCSACHLRQHYCGRGSVPFNQLELFDLEDFNNS